jgi:LPXTG-motif cell wall-anchored protein
MTESTPADQQKSSPGNGLYNAMIFTCLFMLVMTLLAYYQQQLVIRSVCEPTTAKTATTISGRISLSEQGSGLSSLLIGEQQCLVLRELNPPLQVGQHVTLSGTLDPATRLFSTQSIELLAEPAIESVKTSEASLDPDANAAPQNTILYSASQFRQDLDRYCDQQKTLNMVYGGFMLLLTAALVLLFRRKKESQTSKHN